MVFENQKFPDVTVDPDNLILRLFLGFLVSLLGFLGFSLAQYSSQLGTAITVTKLWQ